MKCFSLAAMALFCSLMGSIATGQPQTAGTPGVHPSPFESQERESIREAISSFLNEKSTIRVGIPASNGGHGHQSAGVQVIENLRHTFGYVNRIQVVLMSSRPSELDELATQMELLYPPFNARDFLQAVSERREYLLPKTNVEFYASRHSHLLETLDLGIIGAEDPYSSNHSLKVKELIRLQPFAWKGDHSIVDYDGRFRLPGLFLNLGYSYSLIEPLQLELFLKENMNHVGRFGQKLEAVRTMLLANAYLIPGYGHGLHKPIRIARLLTALSMAAQKSSQHFSKPVLVPIFKNFSSSGVVELSDLISKSNIGRISIIDARHGSGVDSALARASAGDIIGILLGEVPKPVLELIHQKAIVAISEGVNSIHFLKTLGIPFLPTLSSEEYFFRSELTEANPNVSLARRALAEIVEEFRPPNLDVLSDFFVEAMKPDSEMRALFKEHQIQNTLENNKLTHALLMLIERRNLQKTNCPDVLN